MARDAYYEYLRSVPLFAELDARELDAVGKAATELQIPAGETLMREGDDGHEMFVILEGELVVEQGGERIAEIGPGGFVGEMALLTRRRRDRTVTTTTPARVMHIDGRAFANVLRDAPHLAVTMLPIVAARVNENLKHQRE